MGHKKQEHRWSIDFRNLAIGFLLALCVILAMGQANSQTDGIGRYQSCAAGQDALAVFVLDTQTGQTWRIGRTDSYDFGTPYQRKSERHSYISIMK